MNSQLSTALKNCSLEKLPGFVDTLEPVIGKAGGRKFITYPQQNPPLQGTISINEVVKHLDSAWKGSGNTLETKGVEAALNTVTKIQEKDKQADVKLKQKNILIRVVTAIRRFFENIGFNRKYVLESIEKTAKEKLLELNQNLMQKEPKPSQESQVEALLLAVSQLDTNNYTKTRQLIDNSPNDIVCAAIRRSPDNGSILSTMSTKKFESVLKSAAHEALSSNDYQFFSLLVVKSFGQFYKQDIIDIVKVASDGSIDKIELIRSEIKEHLKENALWLKFFESCLDAARTTPE